MSKPVIAIFDVGKTNKKLFLIDEEYNIVYERTARFIETTDEDGDPCENLESLRSSVHDSLNHVEHLSEFDIKAINFSTYGASFVYLDEEGHPLTPLYNYLKPYPEALQKNFYQNYGGEEVLSQATASPVLGSLNSGLQVYRIKYQQPEVFKKIKHALHLPQYMSFLITGQASADITSIGCHTHLWDFTKHDYHDWVYQEGIDRKFGPLQPGDVGISATFGGNRVQVGIGLHDSSAALIPYLANFAEPFVLLSTGTWCISLNPFNQSGLTAEELKKDCLCYMHYKGKAVKASRIFAGNEHEQQVSRISRHFNIPVPHFKHLKFNPEIVNRLITNDLSLQQPIASFSPVSVFGSRDLSLFEDSTTAYHQLMLDLVRQQVYSTRLILNNQSIKRLFVDGGFSKNTIYMHLLATAFPDLEVYASSVAQATAIGTALAMHHAWNNNPVPTDIIKLNYYSALHPAL